MVGSGHRRDGTTTRTRMRRGRLFAAFVCALVATSASPARAGLGDGLRLGAGVLHLGIELDARYDSRAGTGLFGLPGSQPNPPDGVGHVKGLLKYDLATPSVRLNAAGALDWNQYLGLVVNTSALSFLGADASLGLVLNPEGAVGLELTEYFTQSDRSAVPVFGAGVLAITNDARARLRFRPGGGAIEAGAYYELDLDAFAPQVAPLNGGGSNLCQDNPDCNPDLAAAFNALTHRVGVDARWRILPKTGLMLDVNYGFRSYMYEQSRYFPGSPQANRSLSPLRATLGFGTLLSSRFSFNIKGGYNGFFFEDGSQSHHDWLGQAELGYRITETFQTRIGYSRSFEPVGGAYVFFGLNRFYGEVRAQFARFVLTAFGSVDVVGYAVTERNDLNVTVNTRGEFFVTDWLRLTAGVAMFDRVANNVQETEESAFNYNRWEISGGVAALF